ncbi:MAG: HAD hydrolase-like protein [Clostridia bacterium]|nr:HAD hydrolase-like protein [Clostridia bacterium]
MSRNLYIFDCFGVVISDVSTLFMDGKHLSTEEQNYARKNLFRPCDVGQLSMDEMFVLFAKRYNWDCQQIIEEWTSYEYPLTDTLKLIENLRAQGHCIALLSNASVNYVNYLFDKFDVHKLFDYEFVSSAYNCAKPDLEFYKLCVDSFDEKFDKIYFTDDNPNNLVNLQQFGIIPVLFTSADEVAKQLQTK